MGADGGGGAVWELSLAEGFPYFPVRAGRKALRVVSSGHCDPSMGDVAQRLSPVREAMIAFRGTIAGANAPIVIAAQDRIAFSTGPGGNGAAAGLDGELTKAESNAQVDGGLVEDGQSFVTVGAWVQPVEPWTVATGASLLGSVDGSAPRNFRSFLRSPVSPYDRVIIQALAESSSLQLKNGTTTCQFDLGPLSMWSPAAGYAEAKGGNGGIPGAFFYLATESVSGSKGSRAMSAQIRNERHISIESDGANATPAACDVAIPFRIVFVGYPVCNEGAGQGITVEEARQMSRDAAKEAVAEYIRQNGGGTSVSVDIDKAGGRAYRR